uniref:BTB domain-containing protein n=1 Tax=Caenorhabditis tropicalis TaxID=1561998 RepID=A0A1I7TGS9_9PELO
MSSGNQIVKLNIGGAQFHALKSTLIKRSGFFKTLSETGAPVARDEFGAIFIDRSPEHFDLILNFMRDGDVELPDSEKEIKEIQKEADFYQLPSLIKLCEEKIPFKKFRHIKSDFELLDALAAYSKVFIVIPGILPN